MPSFRNKKYLYISFSISDYQYVYPYIRMLENAGYNLKFDYSSRSWSNANAKQISSSKGFIVFFSQSCLNNPKITSEINYASTCDIPFVSVHLEMVSLTDVKRRVFDSGEAILAFTMPQESAYLELLSFLRLETERRHSFSRRLGSIAAIASAGLFVIGCIVALGILFKDAGTNVERLTVSSPAIVSPHENKLELRIASAFGPGDSSSSAYAEIVEKFLQKHPHAGLDVNSYDNADYNAYNSYLFQALNNKDSPDVFTVYYDSLDSRSVEQLNSAIIDVEQIRSEYSEFAKGVYPFALESSRDTRSNRVYAVPIRGYWIGLYCNTNLFLAENVPLPTDWQKLNQAIASFPENGVAPIAASVGRAPNYLVESLILAEAGRKDFETTPKTKADIPISWTGGLSMLKTLMNAGAFPQSTMMDLDSDLSNMFLRNKAAMKIDGSWFCASASSVQDVAVTPFPATPTGQKSPNELIGGYSIGWAISKSAWENPEKRELCIDFINTMMSPKNLAEFCTAGSAPSAPVEFTVTTPKIFKESSKLIENAQSSGRFVRPLYVRLNEQSLLKLYAGAGDIATGRKNPDTVLGEMF
ncbi:MAG: extracellular solute-binding protein [Oscillospiraceae bacterium]|jgi:raffinose/stachyose/melibiose transport system substrate-binding protein|nr:extracellular solute-binding protein [Oscillospiraceae bacterium]